MNDRDLRFSSGFGLILWWLLFSAPCDTATRFLCIALAVSIFTSVSIAIGVEVNRGGEIT